MSSSPVRRSKFTSVSVNEVHSNVSQEVIEITSDKLRLILNEYIDSMSSRKEWHTPFSIFLTLLLVLCTTDFKQKWLLTADTWNAIFIISTILSCLWLISSLIKMKKSISIEDILNAAKNKV